MPLPCSALGCENQGNFALSPIMRERHFLVIEKGQDLG